MLQRSRAGRSRGVSGARLIAPALATCELGSDPSKKVHRGRGDDQRDQDAFNVHVLMVAEADGPAKGSIE
jgi:hypothetical protein